MAYQALYRKYRPTSFDEVVGQEHIIQTLKNAIYQNRIAHAYLFCGPRGTGKTSIAKIFGKMLNCEDANNKPCNKCTNCQMFLSGNHPDIIEIDAASNNGVDEVRNLIDKVKYAPMQGKYKVYIIDEVHMMSTGAFNALLKTIEEPPEHVIFILATTEPNKVIPTIISRCQRFDFSKVSKTNIEKRLKIVCKSENIEIEDEAISLIAQLADGGMRDSLSILDQCVAYCINHIKSEDVRRIYGVLDTESIGRLYDLIYKKNIDQLIKELDSFSQTGIDLQKLTSDFIKLMKESIILEYSDNTKLVSENHKEVLFKYVYNSPTSFKMKLLENLIDTYSKFVYASNILDYLETCFLKTISESDYNSDDKLMKSENHIQEEKIIKIEKMDNQVENQISEKHEEVQKTENIEEKAYENSSDVSRETLYETEEKADMSINNEFLLQLLVSANKTERQNDSNSFTNLFMYLSDLSYAKYASSLRNTSIVASGNTFIVLCTKSNLESKNINEIELHEGYEIFLEQLLGKKKKVFAIDENQKNEVLSEFRERMINKTLPFPIEVKIYEKKSENHKESKTEDKLKNLFSNIEIVED